MASIWFQGLPDVQMLSEMGKGNMGEWLDIQFTAIGENFIKASMPVDHRTKQPFGLLHGGASVVLAETLGSVASALVVDMQQYMCVGMEVNANHVRSARSGRVEATCTPIHLGATSHVWDIRLHDEQHKLLCVSRLTVAVIKRKA